MMSCISSFRLPAAVLRPLIWHGLILRCHWAACLKKKINTRQNGWDPRFNILLSKEIWEGGVCEGTKHEKVATLEVALGAQTTAVCRLWLFRIEAGTFTCQTEAVPLSCSPSPNLLWWKSCVDFVVLCAAVKYLAATCQQEGCLNDKTIQIC